MSTTRAAIGQSDRPQPPFDEDGFGALDVGGHDVIHDSEYGALICRQCRHSINPGLGVLEHLLRKHGGIELAVRKRLIDYAEGLSLVDLARVTVPERTCATVVGLALLDGCECEDCGYACVSEDNMVLHHKRKHGWVKVHGRRWRLGKVQTFFAGNGRKYFVVTPMHERGDGGCTPSAIDRLVEALLEEAKQKDAAEDERLGIVDRRASVF